jgi:hypothetical protein
MDGWKMQKRKMQQSERREKRREGGCECSLGRGGAKKKGRGWRRLSEG